MILIADSGASKIDWRWVNKEGGIEQYQSPGFNPTYQEIEQLDTEIEKLRQSFTNGPIEELYYYGAGCRSKENCKKIHEVLQKHFIGTQITIDDDMLAVARALCHQSPGIACILGTGANSCFYNGIDITESVPALGFVLGDEGSGAYIGKVLVSDYLRHDMPQVLADQFEKRFELGRDVILRKVYQEALPGRFLASFAKFVFQHRKEPYCYQLLYRGFELFFQKNLMKYDQINEVPVHFSGSIAFYFSDILRQVANDHNVVVKNIVESPIAGLTIFHQKK